MTIDAAPAFAPGSSTDQVLFARQGRLARVRLNRPRAINALTDDMVVAILDQLDTWRHDDSVETVLLDGAGDRGLCAGADVRAVRYAIVHGNPYADQGPLGFLAREYELDASIAAYPKAFVALMDGVVMGGGVGISSYGSLRVVTPDSRIAMPETAIGFFPDVGVAYLLARAPGELGTHLALTGATIGGVDAIRVGLADVLLDRADLPALVRRLSRGEAALSAGEPGAVSAPLDADRGWIDQCYAGDDAARILAALQSHPDPRAQAAGALLATRSPLSVAVTLEAVRRAGTMTLAEVFAQDLRLGRAFVGGSDFVEGVRAVLVDKDNAPRWRHASVADVGRDMVERALMGEPAAVR